MEIRILHKQGKSIHAIARDLSVSCGTVIVDVEATPARLSQEIVAAKTMLERSRKRHNFHPDRIAADGSYGTGPFLAWLLKRKVTPHVPG